nr:acyltransferase family protein [uncultured Slackia sp.]
MIAALGINCFEPVGDFLAISRTVVFMPFFLLGYYCTKENFLRIKNAKWLPATGIASIIILALWILLGDPLASYNYISHGDTAYKGSSIEGMGMRVVTYTLAIVISLGVIFITPRRKTFLATIGERTLQVYVLHRLIRPIISELGFFDMPVLSDPILGILIIFIVSVVITLICSIGIIKKPFDLILNAKWEFLRPKRQDA